MLDLRRDGRILRIGHKGAAALEPENTLRSLGRAVELGVDLVEFDVLDLADGSLVLAHSDDLWEVSHGAARGAVRARTLPELRTAAPDLPTLDEALGFLGERAPEVGIHLDLKWRGYEQPTLEALRRHGALDRTFVSSCLADSLHALRAGEPELPLSFTYPFDRRGLSGRRLLAPVVWGAVQALRRTLPRRIGALLEHAGATIATLHWSIVSRAAVERCHARGAAVVAWTVDDRAVLARLDAMGVDGVVTNDPRIFDSRLTP